MALIVGRGGGARSARPAQSSQLGLGVADDLLAVLLGDRVDDRAPVADLAHRAAHDDLLLGHAHAAELHRQPLQVRGPARRLGLRARDLRHRPQPVQDPPRQPDRARELLVDVDRVEVARGARVAIGQVLVRRDAQLAGSARRP